MSAQRSLVVCEHSLRWVLNMRNAMRRLKLPLDTIPPSYLVSKLDSECIQDGHSGGTMAWTLYHAVHMEKIGISKWLQEQGHRGL